MTVVGASGRPMVEGPLKRTLVVTGTLVAGGLAAVWATWYVRQSASLYRPHAAAVFNGLFVVTYVSAGCYTWWRRPRSGLGPLLAAIGFTSALNVLNGSSDDAVYTLGMTAWALTSVLLVYMPLCFPRSRPESPLEVRLARALWFTAGGLWGLILVFAETLPRGGEFSDCGSSCPGNALQVVDAPPGVGDLLDALYSVTLSAVFVAVAVLLVRKARSPFRLRRRAVEPLCYVMCATIVVYVLNLVLARPFPATKTVFFATLGVLFLATPTSIVIGQVRGRMFAAASAGQLAAALSGRAVTPESVQAVMREALGDPTLSLVFAMEGGGYVDVDGKPVELAAVASGRVVTPVVREGRTVAALTYDGALDADAAVVEGLVATSLMLLENAQLVEDLRASRSRIVTASEEERLRLERDLHDGAQQRLMALQIKLALLRERVDEPELAAELGELDEDAASAVQELRGLAHGIYPTVLRERGLADGLRALARGVPLPVEIVDEGIGRCDPTVEAA